MAFSQVRGPAPGDIGGAVQHHRYLGGGTCRRQEDEAARECQSLAFAVYCADNWQSWADLIEKRLGALKQDRPDCAIWLDMRFCLAILTHEPLAYDTVSTTSTVGGRTLRALCMELFWQSLAAQHVTIEHRYLAAVLNVDGLRHPLLANLPFARAESGEIEISAEEFLQQRYDAVEGELIRRPL